MTDSQRIYRTGNWENIVRRYPVGTQHDGIVGKIEPWGVFVALEPGFDALLHISHVRGLNGASLNSVFRTGNHIPVTIAEIDSKRHRIQLSYCVRTASDTIGAGAKVAAGASMLGGLAGMAATAIVAPVVATAALIGGAFSADDSAETSDEDSSPESKEVRLLLLDGSNLARQFPKYGAKTLEFVIKAIVGRGWRYHVFFDRNIDYVLKEAGDEEGLKLLERLRRDDSDNLTVVPAGSEADEFMLLFADKRDCDIISNDTFKAFADRFPWVLDRANRRRVHSFAYVVDELLIPSLDLSIHVG